MSLADVMQQVADDIATATGHPTVADPRAVHLPCILVNPPALVFNTNCGATAEFTLFVLGAGAYNLDAIDLMGQMVAALATVPGVYVNRADPVEYAAPGAEGRVPAYKATFTKQVEL